MHVDDLASAVVFSLRFYDEEGHINVGTGSDVSIAHLAETIAVVVGWEGKFEFDSSMPDGTMRKLLDVSRLSNLGWSASIELSDGIGRTYRDYLATLG